MDYIAKVFVWDYFKIALLVVLIFGVFYIVVLDFIFDPKKNFKWLKRKIKNCSVSVLIRRCFNCVARWFASFV